MSTPIIELIAANIATDIDAITTGNGFNYTLVAVRPRRVMFLDVEWNDLDVIITQAEENGRSTEVGPGATTTIKQFFNLMAIAIDNDTETDSIETKQNKVAADIIKKLITDTNRDGNAIDTNIERVEPLDIPETLSGIKVIIEVTYRVKKGDPFTKA